MSITIDLPPAVIQEAKAFAESRHTTIEQFVINSIDAEVARRKEAQRIMARLEALVRKTGERLTGEPYQFNRADAYGRLKQFASWSNTAMRSPVPKSVMSQPSIALRIVPMASA